MYYIINPLTWPFTVIPNLPQNLIEVIDSPLPLLIGMLGNEKLAKEIDKIREGNNNIILIENEKFKYYKEEKINFDKEPLNNLSRSLKQNYLDLKIESNKSVKNANYRLIIEKIYKNIYGAIKKEICQKIDKICDKYKNQLRKSVLGTSVEALSSQELELRQKLKEEFVDTYSDKKKKVDFYRIFPQTQIFAAYLDKYIENNR
jgi:hypothetical protein